MEAQTRLIGVRHRVKQTKDGEARPTELWIVPGEGRPFGLTLKTEDDEIDFVHGRLPVEWHEVEDDEDTSQVVPRFLKKRKVGGEDKLFVPKTYDGLRAGDRVVMILGGSGDRFAHALSRKGEAVGARVFRVPPYVLKEMRGESEKEEDQRLLVQLFLSVPDKFYLVESRDRDVIEVALAYRGRQFTQRDRIACELRLNQQAADEAYLDRGEGKPELTIKQRYDRLKASSAILDELEKEEAARERAVRDAIRKLPIWQEFFAGIEGCGEVLAAGLVTAIQDIRRFIVLPDQAEMDRLYRECGDAMEQGAFSSDRDHLAGCLTDDMPLYQQLQIVRSWQYEHGREAQAQELERAIACLKERRKLKRKAERWTLNKLRCYCGVHVMQGGRFADVPKEFAFPRTRRGKYGSKHQRLARQIFWLLSQGQFVYRADSEWGQRQRAIKARFQERFPEPTKATNGKTRNNPGHVHKKACWRTASQFCDALGRVWHRIEREQQKKEVKSGSSLMSW